LPLGEEILVYPGVWGGIETPAAYADGVVYVLTANLPTPWTATGFDAEDGGEAVAIGSGYTELNTGWAQAYAIDAANGEIIWEVDFEQVAFGGMTVVNDLVFTARRALSACVAAGRVGILDLAAPRTGLGSPRAPR
jgi:outer membrane protein assembly factor BamB